MKDSELIKAELCFQGICIQNDQCVSLRGGESVNCSIDEQIVKLQSAIKQNKTLFIETWKEMIEMLSNSKFYSFIAGNETTQRMFSNSMKSICYMSKYFNALRKYSNCIYTILRMDINVFSEEFMSDIIEFQIGLDWIYHLIRSDSYKINMLKALKRIGAVKIAQIGTGGGNYGIFPLEMRERVWSYKEDEEDRSEATNDPTFAFWHSRNEVPENYNCKNTKTNAQGFIWEEFRNWPEDKSVFDQNEVDDDNTYPHRNVLWKP